MELYISTYSYARTSLSLHEAAEHAAASGAAGIELVENSALVSPEDFTDFRAHCEALGAKIVCYSTGADFLRCGNIRREIDAVKRKVDDAARLGVTLMRHDVTSGFPEGQDGAFADALPILADACREITLYAQSAGVRTMVENHGFFCQDSCRVKALIERVGHPNYGALIDIGNFLCADEKPQDAVRSLAPYAFHAHCKDFHILPGYADPGEGWFTSRGGTRLRGAIVGHGNAGAAESLQILRIMGITEVLCWNSKGSRTRSKGFASALTTYAAIGRLQMEMKTQPLAQCKPRNRTAGKQPVTAVWL